jgi:hypothetical protein
LQRCRNVSEECQHYNASLPITSTADLNQRVSTPLARCLPNPLSSRLRRLRSTRAKKPIQQSVGNADQRVSQKGCCLAADVRSSSRCMPARWEARVWWDSIRAFPHSTLLFPPPLRSRSEPERGAWHLEHGSCSCCRLVIWRPRCHLRGGPRVVLRVCL